MKKLLLLIIPIIFLTGCIPTQLLRGRETNVVNASFGTYRIDGLVKRSDHSSATKTFYVLEKDKYTTTPDNVSVEVGTNYYSKSQMNTFKTAIQLQLYSQVGRDATIVGNGITTTKGNNVLKFIIKKKNDNTEVTQYYIIGDHKHVLVHETNFNKNTDLNVAVYNIVDTFEWKE